jgi:hypothetical protein
LVLFNRMIIASPKKIGPANLRSRSYENPGETARTGTDGR